MPGPRDIAARERIDRAISLLMIANGKTENLDNEQLEFLNRTLKALNLQLARIMAEAGLRIPPDPNGGTSA